MRGSVVKRKGVRGTVYYVVLRGHWYRVPGATQTARAAELYRAQLLTALTAGELVLDQPRVTVDELAERWVEARRHEWRPHTLRRYEAHIRLVISPVLGRRLIATLTLEDIQRMRAQLHDHYAQQTVMGAIAVLKSMLAAAVSWRLLRSSPAAGLRRGRTEKRSPGALTGDQVQRLLVATAGLPHMRAAILLSLTGGLRVGEVSVARWEYLDVEASTYAVSGTEVEGCRPSGTVGPRVGPTKTAGSAATVLLSPACLAALAVHRTAQVSQLLAIGASDAGWMFVTADGRRMGRGSLQRYWHQATDAAGLPRSGWHILRHTCASLLIDQGAHPKVVQAQLRHATMGMTMDVYGHLFPARQEQAVAGLDTSMGLGQSKLPV